MEHRDLEAEQVLGDIITAGGDVSYYLNDTDGLEGEVEAGYGDRTMEEEGHDYAPKTCRHVAQKKTMLRGG